MSLLAMCMDLGISIPRRVTERQTCPECSHLRRKRNEKCLKVRQTPDGIEVRCKHCEYRAEARERAA